jgi:membrane-associated protein
MIKLKILIFLIVSSSCLYAQPIQLKVLNQYETNIEELSININGIKENLTSEKDGFISINKPNVDSIIFSGKNCADKKMAVSDLKSGATITLKKAFGWKDLINPMFYIIFGGLWLLLFIIFAETGLFAGFFLPGDSLLFVAGIYSDKLAHEFLKLFGLGNVNNQWLDLAVLIALISVAGIIGNYVGYWFGRKVGPAMFTWKDTFLFKQKYLTQAKEFYTKNGGGAIVIARFIPIIRTFAPIVAGIVQMPKAKFSYYNIVGCIAWVASMLCIGHFLDKAFPSLKQHLELIVIGIVLITTAPVLYKLFFGKKATPTN